MTVTNEISANASSQSTGFDVAALFRSADQNPQGDKGAADSSQTPLTEPETAIGTDDADGGAELQDGAGEGEAVNVWQFGGADYNEEQITAALKHSAQYERFNQSVAPVVENIKQFSTQAAQFQAMAVTETEKQITELTAALQSGQLNAQDYQLAHQALTAAQTRKGLLEQAAQQVEAKRVQALNNARRANAQQVAATLARNGWTHEAMTQAQAIAQGAMTSEQFADVVSPAFMELLRDAAAYRAQRATAAAKLQQQQSKAVRTTRKVSTAAAPKVTTSPAQGSDEWINGLWGRK